MCEYEKTALEQLESVAFKITYACNLNCYMCNQRNETHKDKKHHNANLDIKAAKNVIDQVEKYKPQIYIWGGEPLIYPDLDELLEYTNEKKLTTCITTNGTLLHKHVESIVMNKVAEIAVSLDGPKEVHESIRSCKGIFDDIIRGLEMLKEYKKSHHAVLPIVDLHIVITALNHSMLYDFVKWINEQKLCRRIRLQYPMFYTQDMCNQFGKHVEDVFGVKDGKSWTYFSGEYSQLDIEVLKENLRKIKRDFNNIIIYPNEVDTEIWFTKPEYSFRDKCKSAYNRINIEPNGDVVTCTDYPETKYGNIFEDRLENLFNNQLINQHRKKLCNNPKGICSRCSYLYMF